MKNAEPVTPGITYVDVPQIYCKEYDLQNQVCRTCYVGYFYEGVSAVCKQVSSDCRTYNATTGVCTSCFENYYLTNGVCVYGSTSSSIKQP